MVKSQMTDGQILAQIPLARKRALHSIRSEPHAASVNFKPTSRSLHVTLTNGAALTIPVELVSSLAHASNKELADVSIGPAGIALHWDKLDEDLSVAGLARLVLGDRVLLQASGSVGGSARTKAKAMASRRNGQKGGRPRKAAI